MLDSWGNGSSHDKAGKRQKALLLGMAIALVTAMVGLGVHAQFQDTEAASTTWKAGKLDLKVNGGDKPIDIVIDKCLKPGDSNYPCACYTYTLTNDGCVAGFLDLVDIKVTEDENVLIEPEAEAGDTTPAVGELGEHIKIKLSLKDHEQHGQDPKVLYEGMVKDIKPLYDIDEFLPGCDKDLIVECWWWPPSATDSQAMTDIVKLSMKFSLQQFPD
jgi:hypothetical protein